MSASSLADQLRLTAGRLPTAEALAIPIENEGDLVISTTDITLVESESPDVVPEIASASTRKRKRASPPPMTRITRSRSSNAPLSLIAATQSVKACGSRQAELTCASSWLPTPNFVGCILSGCDDPEF